MRSRLSLSMTSHFQNLQHRKLMLLLTKLTSRVCKNTAFFFFFKGNMLIRSLSVLPAGFHSISMFFFTGAALNNSRTVSCFMLLYDVTIDVYVYSV